MQKWWERFPVILEEEEAELDRAGIRYERIEEAWAKGVYALRLWHEFDGREVELIALYPDLYPFFRFEVYTPKENLFRHQNPFEKNLCLIGRATANWDVDDNLAWFVLNQVPRVLRLGQEDVTEQELADEEEHQGEPFSDYYRYEDGSVLVIDSGWRVPKDCARGLLLLRVEDRSDALLRGVVAEVQDEHGAVLGSYPAPVRVFPKELRGRWVRVAEPIVRNEPKELMTIALAAHPGHHLDKQRTGQFAFDVVGVVFPEEVTWRQNDDGWVFVTEWRPAKRPGDRRSAASHYLTRASRAGKTDLAQRIPELAPLAHKSIAVFGLGGLGAPSALEFARAQVRQLRIADHDFVDAGTAVRWPFGLAAAGIAKVDVARFIEGHWPFVDVLSYRHRLGRVASGDDEGGDLQFVEEFLDGVDLVYDASAELGIQYFLSDECRRRGISYLAVDATEGEWGGRVVRIAPGITQGCWVCSRTAFTEGDIALPPASPTGWVQPPGCAEPTFTGASFDLLPVVAMGVRTAVATLCRDADDAYPDPGWDIAVLSLRDQTGALPAVWHTEKLARHPRCPRCS